MRNLTVSAAVLLALAASPGRADEGSIPIYGFYVISQPGDYIVTRDITVTSGHGLVINASNVTLDLNGHTITGPVCSGAGERVIALSAGTGTLQGIVIRNGRLTGACDGIGSGSGTLLSARIERVEVSGALGPGGIVIDKPGYVEILGCHVHNVSGLGISLGQSASPAFGGNVSDNRIENAGQDGIRLTGMAAGVVRRNLITNHGTGLHGIELGPDPNSEAGGNLVEQNTITGFSGGTGHAGVRVLAGSPNNFIIENVITACNEGIVSSANGTRIERNVASRNGFHGIQITSAAYFNHLEENQAQANSGASSCGISFDSGKGHVYRNNNVVVNASSVPPSNTGGGICGTLSGNTDGGGNIQ